ncbi:MAG: tRNA (guanosine(37)-N1)-methyltransferase TrmD [Christensenellaceae bacterium]|jgi:tRNA (guanine37-N1)-methyltransferase|nr:tRNA (guanosine(37)-N1)-methyltransferase TrmD [Christensenellaceae bacterium]
MIIDIITLFPEIYSVLNESVLGRAQNENMFKLNLHHLRDYSEDKHKRCDDTPYGGGVGMVMTPQPLHSAINATDPNRHAHRIYLSPKGKLLNQQTVVRLSKIDHIMLVNGYFEGIDERIISLDIDEEISIGDYILTSGDFASLALISAIVRYIPGVLGNANSTNEETFSNGLLEYPQYTRPRTFMGEHVPDVLLGGNHREIAKWRLHSSLSLTKTRRPDLLQDTTNIKKLED